MFKLLHFAIPDFAVSTQFMYVIIYGGLDVCTSVFKIKFTNIYSSEFLSQKFINAVVQISVDGCKGRFTTGC